jgi:DNA-binding transcriptional MerR regulator
MTDMAGMAGAAGMTVEELAERSGESVRTIRFYQSEGVLPPPTRQGRQVRYDTSHLERLRAISELQHRGLRLAAIKDLLRYAPDTAAADWLGLGEYLARPWSEDRPGLLQQHEMDEAVAGLADHADAAIAELVRAGVVERRDDATPLVYFVPSMGMLEAAITATRLGLDPQVATNLRDLIQHHLRSLAVDLVVAFAAEGVDMVATQGPAAIAELLDRLRPVTRRTVDLLFAHEMERAQRGVLQAAVEETEQGNTT